MTKIIERKGQEITLNDKTVTVKKSFNRISCRISGVIGHVIGKLIWVASVRTQESSSTIIKFCFQRRGNSLLLQKKKKKKYSSLSFPFPFITVGWRTFAFSLIFPIGSEMLLILRSNSDGQTTFEQALKLIYPKCLFSSWIRKKRQLHATYRRSQWLPKWPKK